MKKAILIVCAVAVVGLGSVAMAVDIVTVPVGNVGNTGELSGSGAGGFGPNRIVGAVDYKYRIGKYEVTNGQYTEFLNSVAGVDTYGLYDNNMWWHGYGCKIERYSGSGTSADPYQYRITADRANRPAGNVDWGSAARFANWMHNGQPTGTLNGDPLHDAGLTEDGAYYLNGATSTADLLAVSRKPNAKWAISSEDEWYKAAYYDPSLNNGSGGYYDYPTMSDSRPGTDITEMSNPGNNANYTGPFPIDPPYYTTLVGQFELSESPYGTFDQGGNVSEWNESVIDSYRGMLGGAYGAYGTPSLMHASYRRYEVPSVGWNYMGFRVAQVPEPTTLSLLALGGLAMLRRRRK